MNSYVDSFRKFALSAQSTPKGAEDYFDRLNYVITPGLLLAVATIVGMKQYVFEPIQCWSIKELDSARMEYAENYCWVENTFFHDPRDPIEHVDKPGEGRTIYYYQWVPFILMAQAALFYVPHLLWLLLSTNVGIDMRQLATQARNIDSHDCDDNKRRQRVTFLAESLLKFIRYRARYQRKTCCQRAASVAFGRPAFAMYFGLAYVLVKLCYVANCVGQMHLMRSFLGLNMTSFGFQILGDIMANRTWQSSNVFPRVTYCNFEVRNVGKPRNYILQCVLPVNMLNEKFYIAIWFWVAIMLTFNAASALRCLAQLLVRPSRQRTIRRYLKIAESLDAHLAEPLKRFRRLPSQEADFVQAFLRTDGYFVLTVVNRNAGDLVTAEVVRETFQRWRAEVASNDEINGRSDGAAEKLSPYGGGNIYGQPVVV